MANEDDKNGDLKGDTGALDGSDEGALAAPQGSLSPAPSDGKSRMRHIQRSDDPEEDEDDGDEDGSPPMRISPRVQEIMAMFSSFGPAPFPLAEKLTPEHISTLLDIDRQKVNNERASENEGRRYGLIAAAMFLVFVLLMLGLLLWRGNDALTEKVIIGTVTLIAGALGGYGVGTTRNKS